MMIAFSISYAPFTGILAGLPQGCTRRRQLRLQPRPEFASIKAWMSDDVQQLLQKRKYSAAFEQLLELYGKKVFRMAVMMMHDAGRAEEVTQDIFLKLWQALPAYDGRASPSTWLYTIARNTCLSVLRADPTGRRVRSARRRSRLLRAQVRSRSNWNNACRGFPKCNAR